MTDAEKRNPFEVCNRAEFNLLNESIVFLEFVVLQAELRILEQTKYNS